MNAARAHVSKDKGISTLLVEVLPDGRNVRLINPLVAQLYRQGITVTVPEGFVTDFASVPRIFWRVFPPWGKYSPAAVVHDWMYVSPKHTKDQADAAFLELMQRLGVARWRLWPMFAAVRLFGGRKKRSGGRNG